MMDAAAIDLSIRKDAPVEARLFLRSAIACVNIDLATPLHISTEPIGTPTVTGGEFSEAVHTLIDAGYPGDVRAEMASKSFLEVRAKYDATICRILDAIVAPEAPWTARRTLPIRRGS